MTLDCIVIEQFNKRIHLRDPWLNVQPEKQASDNLSSIMQSYPSP